METNRSHGPQIKTLGSLFYWIGRYEALVARGEHIQSGWIMSFYI